MKRILLPLLAALLALSIHAQHGLYVGGDISLLPSYEASQTVYLDGQGQPIADLVPWLTTECGWNTYRVRLFVNPTEKAGEHTGVVQDMPYVTALAKRVKAAGAKLLLDFHYSDTWGDPSHQTVPAAWADCTTSAAKAARLYEYTTQCLAALNAEGATPDFVQVGNEISYGMVGIQVHPYNAAGDDWDGLLTVLTAGCRAVREQCPQAKIIIHTERSGQAAQTVYYYNKLATLDYDIIGLSYYPFYHGFLTSLRSTLTDLATTFPQKQVFIVETAYPIQWWPQDATVDTRSQWAVAEGKCDGQYQFAKDLIATLKDFPQVTGLTWWMPEEAGNGDAADWTTGQGVVIGSWLNRGLWWPTISDGGHWPLTTSAGGVLWLLQSFLDSDASAVTAPVTRRHQAAGTYNVAGQRISPNTAHGIVVSGGKKLVTR